MHSDTTCSRLIQRQLPIVIALLLASLCCSKQDPLENLEVGTVAAVRDGDTIELTDGRVVRYCGIDTPERGQPWYDSATAFNAQWVVGKKVRLEQGDDRIDRYGRTLAFVFVDNRMVNLEILKAGLAWCYLFDGNLKYGPDMVRGLRDAMTNHRGMWRQTAHGDESSYLGSFRGFRFHRPSCASASDIKLDDLREFPERDSAFYAGYSPCKSCQP